MRLQEMYRKVIKHTQYTHKLTHRAHNQGWLEGNVSCAIAI